MRDDEGCAMTDSSPVGPPRRFDASQGPRIVGPLAGKTLDLRTVGVRYLVMGEESGGGFSLVEHPIPARFLAAPLHRHAREDEYSYVLEGRLGAQLGDDVVFAEAGDLAFKPRDQWHTFWNAGDGPCRILEIISPAGFEHYFEEVLAAAARGAGQDELAARYGLEVDLAGTRQVLDRQGLRFLRPSAYARRR
jgi:mannose-6-phosphate isomerase-like protein (cupin superfamily)